MGKEYTEAKAAYMEKFYKNKTTRVVLQFHNETDADILTRLNEVGNKQGYIKRLIREDISK